MQTNKKTLHLFLFGILQDNFTELKKYFHTIFKGCCMKMPAYFAQKISSMLFIQFIFTPTTDRALAIQKEWVLTHG